MELTRLAYIDQAKWYLNGFWKDGAEQASESIWAFAQKFMELDPKKKAGNELDEFWSHKFLESLGETLTVIQLREKLRKIDADANGKMALLEYLLFKFSKTVTQCINAPQGDNHEEVEAAQEKLQEVQASLLDPQRKLEEQKIALENQRNALAAQKKAVEEQRRAEDSVKQAEAELKAAVDDLRAQEQAFHDKIKDLEQKSKDPNSTVVAKNKAANELAQLKQENPLPLRKAKITQEAALRKVEKQRKEVEAATRAAEAKERELHEKTKEVERKTKEVEVAVEEAEEAVREAEQMLEELKAKGGSPLGAIWWMERELKEAQKYLPRSKQTL